MIKKGLEIQPLIYIYFAPLYGDQNEKEMHERNDKGSATISHCLLRQYTHFMRILKIIILMLF